MAAHKIIFVSQEISPYLSVTDNSRWGRMLPQSIQSKKYEVRIFMPDFGVINERRNAMHEVIRLSGMNIAISDTDHLLVVKVASMQPSRIQVYFIDNDDFFIKENVDDPFGFERPDNDERLIFFTRGTVETARKLRWEPEVMQLSGWWSSIVPLYVRRVFNDSPAFESTKLVYTVLQGEQRPETLDPAFMQKLQADGVPAEDVARLAELPNDSRLLDKIAILYADAVVFQGPEPDEELTSFCEANGKKWLKFDGEGDHAEDYDALYKSLMA